MMHGIELPPVPDRNTGQPRPPRAPARKRVDEGGVPWNARRVPQPPNNEGPVFEWHYENHKSQLLQAGVAAVIFIVFATIYDGGLGWVRHWYLWAIVVAFTVLIFLGARTQRYAAGADWFMHRKDFVRIYELVSIRYVNDYGDGTLEIDDRHGGGVRASLTNVWDNPDMWDLVYNGIRHSVVNGAWVNRRAVDRLQLRDVVAVRLERFGPMPADPPQRGAE